MEISQNSVQKILKYNNLNPFKISLFQELSEHHNESRLQFFEVISFFELISFEIFECGFF